MELKLVFGSCKVYSGFVYNSSQIAATLNKRVKACRPKTLDTMKQEDLDALPTLQEILYQDLTLHYPEQRNI